MPKPIHINAFDMNCVGHIQQGLWTHPRDQSTRYLDLRYWTDYARRLEAGLFDGKIGRASCRERVSVLV